MAKADEQNFLKGNIILGHFTIQRSVIQEDTGFERPLLGRNYKVDQIYKCIETEVN